MLSSTWLLSSLETEKDRGDPDAGESVPWRRDASPPPIRRKVMPVLRVRFFRDFLAGDCQAPLSSFLRQPMDRNQPGRTHGDRWRYADESIQSAFAHRWKIVAVDRSRFLFNW